MIALRCVLCGEPNSDILPMVARHDQAAAVCVPCVLIAAGAIEAKGYDTSPEAQRAAYVQALGAEAAP